MFEPIKIICSTYAIKRAKSKSNDEIIKNESSTLYFAEFYVCWINQRWFGKLSKTVLLRLDGAESLTIAIFASLSGIGLGLLICPKEAYIRGKINKPMATWE